MDTIMGDLTKIAALLIGGAILALLVGHSQDSSRLIQASSSGFSGLLKDVTLQDNTVNTAWAQGT